MEYMIDRLILEDEQLLFETQQGKRISLPNLSELIRRYKEDSMSDVGKRIKRILELDLESLLIAEVMIDMSNETTCNRLLSGEISKNLTHVDTYSIILDSHMDYARAMFEQMLQEGVVEGDFEDCFFAQFPCGMVIVKEKFEMYQNENYDRSVIDEMM